ncbi:MAG: hypothetical protein R6U95_03140, partial [Bacteroidales bacterium]
MRIQRFFSVFVIVFLAVISAFSQKDLVISGGNSVSSFVCNNRKVYAWGNNKTDMGTGLLGTGGTNDYYSEPEPVIFPINPDTGNEYDIKQVNSGSGSHFVALDCYNEVWAWGNNSMGQVGNDDDCGEGCFVDEPTKVLALPEIDAYYTNNNDELINADVVYAGNNTSYAILDNGDLVSWGANGKGFDNQGYDDAYGQLGNGTYPAQGVADNQSRAGYVRVPGDGKLTNVIEVFAGDNCAYALVDDDGDGVGTVYSWGDGKNGSLGRNADATANPGDASEVIDAYARPVLYEDGSPMDNITTIASGDVFGSAIDTDGYIWSWGNGGWNDATGTGQGSTSIPYRVLAGATTGASNDGTYLLATSVGGGQGYGMAVTIDGKPVAWGGGGCGAGGATGNGTTDGSADEPQYIQYAPGAVHEDVILINRGDTWGFYGLADGSMWAWGCNEVGQLGLGSTIDASYASEIAPPTGCGFPDPRPFVSLTPGDMTVCESEFLAGPGVLLKSGFETEVSQTNYEIRWYKDDQLDESGTALNALDYSADEPGDYRVEIEYIGENTGCKEYDVEVDSMTIDVYPQTFSIPELTYCGDSAYVYVDANQLQAVYSWYPTETSSDVLGTSIGADSIKINVANAESGTGTNKIVYVEESNYARGTVLEKDEGCDPTWFTAETNLSNGIVNQDNSFATGFTVTEDITLEELSFMFRSSLYSVGESGSAEIAFGVFGSTMNNNGYVADNSDLIGTLYTEYDRTRDSDQDQDLDVQLTAKGDVYLEPGVYFIGIRSYNGSGLQNSKIGRGNCSLYPGIDDNVSGEIIKHDVGVSGHGNPDQNTSGFVFDIQFTTLQHFCDRIPVPLVEACPCESPRKFNITTDDADSVLCAEQSTLLSPDTVQANTDDFDFTWYKDGLETTNIVQATEANVNTSTYTVDFSEPGNYILLVRDKNMPSAQNCWMSDSIQIDSASTPTYTLSGGGVFCEEESIDSIEVTFPEGTAPYTISWDLDGTTQGELTAEDTIRLDSIAGEYAVKLASQTRPGGELAPDRVTEYLSWGAGPRASQYLV